MLWILICDTCSLIADEKHDTGTRQIKLGLNQATATHRPIGLDLYAQYIPFHSSECMLGIYCAWDMRLTSPGLQPINVYKP